MAKSIRNVMAAIKPEDQINGLTETEIRTEFMKAGYGVTKAAKRTNELKAGPLSRATALSAMANMCSGAFGGPLAMSFVTLTVYAE